MTGITREVARDIVDEINGAVAEIAAKHGFEMVQGRSSFSLNNIKPNFTIVTKDDEGAITPERAALDRLHPGVYGKTYDIPRIGRITMTGYNTRAPKYPFQYTKDGKKFKHPRGLEEWLTEDWEVEA